MAEVLINTAGTVDLLSSEFNTNQLEKSPYLENSPSFAEESPSKAQPDQTNAEEVNKIVKEFTIQTTYQQPPVSTYEPMTTTNYEVQEYKVHTPKEPADINQELNKLHSQIDDVLRKSTGFAPALQTPYSARSYTEDYTTTNYLNKPQELAKSSYAGFYSSGLSYKPYEEQSRKSSYSYRPNEQETRKSSYSARSYTDEKSLKPSASASSFFKTQLANEYKPKYDVEKLDRIVNRILSNPLSYDTIKKYGEKSKNLNEIILSKTSHNEAPVKSRVQHQQQHQPEQIEKPYFCGEMQNDKDSVMGDYVQEHVNNYEAKKQQLTNFYVGSLIDDIDEVPRNKKIGRRQEIAQSRKLRAEEAKQFFVEDERHIEDFDFSQHRD